MVRLCGACLSLFAFAIVIFLGLLAGNPVEVTLWRGLWGLLVFFGLGLIVGWVAHRVLDEHALRRRKELFPEEVADDRSGSGPSADLDRI